MLLRNFTVIGLTFATVMDAAGRFPIDLPTVPFASVSVCLALFNLATFWRLARAWRVTDAELLGHILADIVAMTMLLYFSGGTASPFVGMLLVFVAIAGASLPWSYSACAALVTVACYAVLDFVHADLPPAGFDMQNFQKVAFSLWMNYSVGVAVVAYFIGAISKLLREQSRALSEARQREISHDYVVRVGSLVTGAAHEIRSSLATVAILVKELLRDESRSSAREVRIIADQIEACRRSLSDMMVGHGAAEVIVGERESVKLFLREIIDRFEVLRPGVKLACRWRGSQPSPEIRADRCLSQAILNLLDNAADAAPDEEIEMNCSWSPRDLQVAIKDRGPGFSHAPGDRLGHALLTTKGEKGTGIGLLLARTAIQKAGGTLMLTNRPGGGACAEVFLPLEMALDARSVRALQDNFDNEENHGDWEERFAEPAARG